MLFREFMTSVLETTEGKILALRFWLVEKSFLFSFVDPIIAIRRRAEAICTFLLRLFLN